MDIISHLVFAALLNGAHPSLWVFLGAVVPDIDKIITYPKRHFSTHMSRTLFTELPLESILIAVSVFILPEFALGLISHYVLDYISGETKPFHPFFGNVVNFELGWKIKLVLGVIFWIVGWILVVKVWNFNIITL